MAIYGRVISKYRKLQNLTQKDLAEKLFVSPQTVSKWENNQSEPNLATIKQLADLFGISVDDFFEEGRKFAKEEKESSFDVLRCEMCLEAIKEDKVFEPGEKVLCDKCKEELEKEEKFYEKYEDNKEKKATKGNLKGIIPFYIGWSAGLALFIITLIAAIIDKELNGFAAVVLMPFFVSFFVMCFLTQMIYNSWLREFVGYFIGKRFRPPGIIFELSLIGILKLIFVKILFGLLVLLFTLTVFVIGLILGIIISPVSYIVELITKIKKGFDYELV